MSKLHNYYKIEYTFADKKNIKLSVVSHSKSKAKAIKLTESEDIIKVIKLKEKKYGKATASFVKISHE